jgi:ankyrin repeat protein
VKLLGILALATFISGPALAAQTTAPAPKDTRLVDAIKAGNATTALALLQKKVDVNVPEPDGTTPLHWAVRNDDSMLIDRLLKAGANPKTENRYGITPIYLACVNGSASAVDRLINAGVSANATGPLGETALMTCARTGNVAAARVLLAHGAIVDAVEAWHGQTALMWATAQGHADMMRALVQASADVNARSAVVEWERQRTLEPRDKWLPPGGLTPLLYAARQGCLECAKVLVAAGADVNVVDPDRISALVSALINGHYDVAGFLVQSGVELTLADKTGRTALYAAVDDHTMPSSNRPSPKETDDELTSLDVVKLLLDRGAPVNAPLRSQIPYRTKLDRGGDGVLGAGTTPLLRAAKAGDVAVVKLLLAKGANPKATTANGVSAIAMAANVGTREEDMTGRGKTQKQAIEVIRLLLDAGASVDVADNQGRTAAHGAALWGLTDVVKFLADNGAKLDIKDKRGFTALHYSLGMAGGLGFDGRTGAVHEDTAKAIKQILGMPADAPVEKPASSAPAQAREDIVN